MIGYVTLGSDDIPRAAAFYDALLAEIGASRMMEEDGFIAWSAGMNQPALSVIKPYNKEPATVGNGVMVALIVETPEQVDALHAKAMSLGAQNEGDPGERGGGFYGGYFRDPDGNKLNFFCFRPPETAE